MVRHKTDKTSWKENKQIPKTCEIRQYWIPLELSGLSLYSKELVISKKYYKISCRKSMYNSAIYYFLFNKGTEELHKADADNYAAFDKNDRVSVRIKNEINFFIEKQLH